jgi:hypothetical protein
MVHKWGYRRKDGILVRSMRRVYAFDNRKKDLRHKVLSYMADQVMIKFPRFAHSHSGHRVVWLIYKMYRHD